MIKNLLKKILPEKVTFLINQKRHAFKIRKSLKWALGNASDVLDFMSSVDKNLSISSEKFSRQLQRSADQTLSNSAVQQGGGGAYGLLYFLVRKTKPESVLETGVASGWSSNAILSALQENNRGRLYSSDLPYPDREGSRNVIGILVEETLKQRWTLCVDGDLECLPRFVDHCEGIDLFHYDSNKSYKGRVFAWNAVKASLSNDSLVIYDDIQDNFHFRDLVQELGVEFRVFEFEGKYIGLFYYGGKITI